MKLTKEQEQFKPTFLEWKVKIAEAKIAHLLELHKAKVSMLGLGSEDEEKVRR